MHACRRWCCSVHHSDGAARICRPRSTCSQCLGWAIFELIVIATAAGLLCDKLFGFEGVWIWKLVFGAAPRCSRSSGPVGFVRRFVRKFAIWAVLASVIYLAWWIIDGADVGRIWSEGGHNGSFWLAVDTVVAVTVSWAPLVADYTRFSRDRRSAFFGVGIGYLLPTLFQFGFGSILVLSRGRRPESSRADPDCDRRRRVRRGPCSSGADRRRDRRGVRQRVLRRRLDAEPLPADPAARIDRRRFRGRNRRRARDRHAQLSALPAAARGGVRPAPRRADRGLAAGRRSLHAGARLRRAGLPPGQHRRLARRLLRLRVAQPAGRARLLEPLGQPPADAVVPVRRLRCRALRSHSCWRLRL